MANYRDEFNRICSYPTAWALGHTKADLARDGFYCVNQSNVVVCFCCNLKITVERKEYVHIKNLHMQKSQTCAMNNDPKQSGNIPMEHTKIYKCEKDRLYSFLIENFTWPVNVYELAKSGFYYDPLKKSSCCFTCKLQIGSWTAGDSGNSEHQKYNPQCFFFCQNPTVENVPLGSEKTPDAKKIIDAAMYEVTMTQEQPADVAKKIANMSAPPKHSKYKEKRERIASYSTWPASMKQRPGELAEAGFYYASRGDRVICYQCGGGLRDWSVGDRPWNEHGTWFPQCPLVEAVMGNAFISKMQQEKISGQRNSTIVALLNPEAPDEEEVPNDESPAIEVPMDDTKEVRLCKVCLTNELGIVFLPCAHMATCPDCAPQLTNCPICRSNFTAYVRAFLPF